MAAKGGGINDTTIKTADTDSDLQPIEYKTLNWYKVDISRVVVFYFLGFLSLGILLLVSYWFPRVKCFIIGQRCEARSATHAMIRDLDNDWNLIKIHSVHFNNKDLLINEAQDEHEEAKLVLEQTYLFRYFIFRHARYIIDEVEGSAQKQTGYDVGYTCEQIYQIAANGTTPCSDNRAKQYGHNLIDVPVKSYLQLFIEEVLNPFYIFQIFSIIIWLLVNYYYYAGAVFLISIVSISLSVYQTRQNMVQLKNMIAFSCKVTVHRGASIHPNTPSSDLYPGDVIEIPRTGLRVPCDCALISGNAIVNESMLTGESVPVFKTPLPHDAEEIYSVTANKRQTLFNGTDVIQTRNLPNSKVLAFVIRTGYSTSKGELVRSIIYPNPTRLRFYRQSLKFLAFLILLGVIGMLYTVIYQKLKGEKTFTVILQMADLFTTAVPPSLPAAMTVGVIYAIARLKKRKVFCISPQRINVCGKIKCVCFDKTGTLTEDGLCFWGVVPVSDTCKEPVRRPNELGITPLTIAMASCHSLTLVNGQLVGDSVDLHIFKSTDWLFEEPQEETNRFDLLVPALVRAPNTDCKFEAGILHQYPFSSELQRMSVVVKCLRDGEPGDLVLYSKGSPEMIASLSVAESLPGNFTETLTLYTKMGLRVLAIAYKELTMPWHKVSRIPRHEMESDLRFLGLILMQNTLKPVTTSVIRELSTADIRVVMITGDNLLTAVNVAMECQLINPKQQVFDISIKDTTLNTPNCIDNNIIFTPQNNEECFGTISGHDPLQQLPRNNYCLAVSGTTFELIHTNASRHVLTAVLLKCAVFARMSPKQKSIVVEELQKLGYVVAMCGDGANDCGALKSADVGVSLSDSEASVASHFTSKIQDISCISVVVKEGRTALVTSFSIFKFMALYSVTEFTSVVILYWWLSNLGDWQYLYIDLIQIFALALVMGYTKPYSRLAVRRPSANLVNPINLISCAVHIVLVITFQVCSYLLLRTTLWYVPADLVPKAAFDDSYLTSFEDSVIFAFSTFQYLILAFVFSVGPPYRMPFYTNIYFLVCFIILTLLSLVFTFLPGYHLNILNQIYNFVQIKYIYSWTFKLGLVLFAGVHLCVSTIVEDFIVQTECFRLLVHFILCKRRQKNLYKRLLVDLKTDYDVFRDTVLRLK